jgi:hypothetical protein
MVFFCFGALFGQTITVTSPAAGVNWIKGTTQTITWTRSGTMDSNVKIFLFDQTGSDRIMRITASTPNNGSFRWTVSETPDPGRYRIRVRTVDDQVTGHSNVFSISDRSGGVVDPVLISAYSIESLEIFDAMGTIRNVWVNDQLLFPYNRVETRGNAAIRVRWNRIPPPSGCVVQVQLEKRYLRDRHGTWAPVGIQRVLAPFDEGGVAVVRIPFTVRAGEPNDARVNLQARLVFSNCNPAPHSSRLSRAETLTLREANVPIDLAVQHLSGELRIVRFTRSPTQAALSGGRHHYRLNTKIRLRNTAPISSQPIPNVQVAFEIHAFEDFTWVQKNDRVITAAPVPSDRWIEVPLELTFSLPPNYWHEVLLVVAVDPDERIADTNRANNRLEHRFRAGFK